MINNARLAIRMFGLSGVLTVLILIPQTGVGASCSHR